MRILECECGFNIADEPPMGIIMFVEHRKTCPVWNKIFKETLGKKD